MRSNRIGSTMNTTELLEQFKYAYLHQSEVDLTSLEPYINYYVPKDETWDKFIFLLDIKSNLFDPASFRIIYDGIKNNKIYKCDKIPKSDEILDLIQNPDRESQILGFSLLNENHFIEIHNILFSKSCFYTGPSSRESSLVKVGKAIYLAEKVEL